MHSFSVGTTIASFTEVFLTWTDGRKNGASVPMCAGRPCLTGRPLARAKWRAARRASAAQTGTDHDWRPLTSVVAAALDQLEALADPPQFSEQVRVGVGPLTLCGGARPTSSPRCWSSDR